MSAAQTPAGYIVTLTTRHFHFEGHGVTEEEANEAMGRALVAHGRQMDLPNDWADPYLGEFQTTPFHPGASFRDGVPI